MDLGMILQLLGLLIGAVGGIWLIVLAFQESVGLGLATMLIPCFALYFVATHWETSKAPFAIAVLGTVIRIAGMAMSTNPAIGG